MSTRTTNSPLPREITARLARLRWYIRGYLCARGLALVLAAAAAAFWVSLALDWLWEPTAAVRVAVQVLAVLAIGFVLVRHWLAHMLVPLSDRNMAMLLERSDRRLDDRLLTVVELTGRHGLHSEYGEKLLAHTGDEARALIAAVRPLTVLSFRPLMWALALAVLAGLSIALLNSAYPKTLDTWVRRSLLLGPQRWERDTLISVEGFPADQTGRRSVKVAVGGDVDVRALADTTRLIPGKLDLTYYGADGARLTQSMTKQGTAIPPRDPHQEYFYNFKNIQNTIRFSVRAQRERVFGKDDVVENLWIDAVESPALSNLSLRCIYPAYTRAKYQEHQDVVPVTGIMPIPEGTQVVVEANATKELASVECQIAGETTKTEVIEVSAGGRRFRLPLGGIRRNTIVSMTLTDTDGVSNRQPARLQIRVLPDQAPQLDVRLADIGKAITPRAQLPLRGTIQDDYGLSKTWFEYLTSLETEKRGKGDRQAGSEKVRPNTPHQKSFNMPADGLLSAKSGVALDVSSLELKPGSRFYVWVKGADACPLDAEPHVGSSQRIDLEVVTEQQLRGMLEGTELVLRRRFEGIMADLRRTGDTLHRIESDDAPGTAAKPDSPSVNRDERTQNRAAIRVAEALERCGWSMHETGEVADQFQRILNELENNRVEHLDEQRSRLGDRIVVPLREIVQAEFPKLKDRLQHLRRSLADDSARRRAAVESEKQLDAVLLRMDQVLAEMVESEGFNELLAQLRIMIQSHDDVVRLTRERQQQLKKQLREGLE